MPELIPHLFRTEYRKIVAVLCKHFGFRQIEIAEDIASDTFLVASQTWGIEGVPKNPTAWLHNVAKNKAINHLQRNALFENKISEQLKDNQDEVYEDDIDLSPLHINDSQLQMMFAVCHPSIPTEAQVGLCLRILCGFGIEEIADAFLSNKETINKRLFRAKEKLREENIPIELPNAFQIEERLQPVLTTIYLLFNEGYYSVSQNTPLKKDLCLEAIRLCTMLVENTLTNKPQANALLALMCFHISRFDARMNESGELVLYEEQDINLWNPDWISKGGYFLHCAASGDQISKYHLEAGIAYWHTQKNDSTEKWDNILQLYNQLLQIEYSPIAALNRTYALSKARGNEAAITEAEKLQLTNNFFYYLLLGELYAGINNEISKLHFDKALMLAKTPVDRQAVQKKVDAHFNN
ncbi:sigma-70 family RNA polymerase sigma factor [Danxiaibacter flavus]|uniref:Sigma-70 family RNA polymerase sigma factor n=1 Tax=Danxiaibacter flavus TaxID=3049108 RepID=A0ABV3ZJC4_9BACT|nr:sigma-70 family RNA polymerase sigma factor [Chitinophagaceae bacterium DXS]